MKPPVSLFVVLCTTLLTLSGIADEKRTIVITTTNSPSAEQAVNRLLGVSPGTAISPRTSDFVYRVNPTQPTPGPVYQSPNYTKYRSYTSRLREERRSRKGAYRSPLFRK